MNQVGRAGTAGESDDKVWLAFVDHLLIANRPRLAAVLWPIGVELPVGNKAAERPSLRQTVSARGGAVDEQSDWLFGVQFRQGRPDVLLVMIVATAANKDSQTVHVHLPNFRLARRKTVEPRRLQAPNLVTCPYDIWWAEASLST
jgi:hypothetical protein